jgi:indolepyruvate ferredoxin oxidoreductase alpha subunit
LLKEAVKFSRQSGPAVVISRHPCILDRSRKGAGGDFIAVEISDRCDGCGYCITHFECPALIRHEGDPAHVCTSIDPMLCVGCGVCLEVCPKGAFQRK